MKLQTYLEDLSMIVNKTAWFTRSNFDNSKLISGREPGASDVHRHVEGCTHKFSQANFVPSFLAT
jgi:hypothetical protein